MGNPRHVFSLPDNTDGNAAKKYLCGDGNWYYRLENLEVSDGEQRVSPTTHGQVFEFENLTLAAWTALTSNGSVVPGEIIRSIGWGSVSLSSGTSFATHVYHETRITGSQFQIRTTNAAGDSGQIRIEYTEA